MADLTITGDTLRLHWRSFGLEDYETFLKAKRLPESQVVFHPEDETYSIETPARFAPLLGVELGRSSAQDLPLASFLYDDQAAIVRMALDAKRFACWSDCGLGKTLIQLEFARHVIHRTGGRVLLVTMNDIVAQTIAEGLRFYPETSIRRLAHRAEMRAWMKDGCPGLSITNYEKWNPEGLDDQVVNEARHLSGIILDESSRLKTGGGKQKWALIKSCKGIEYKLSCTATPAPNDLMEFASQAAFLEKMRSEGDIIWTYFTRDRRSHRWTVKPHAREAFFKFMSSWSIYVRNPKRYGWRLDLPEPPAPSVTVHEIGITPEQQAAQARILAGPEGQLALVDTGRATNAIERGKLAQLAKGFRYKKGDEGAFERIRSLKPDYVAHLIHSEASLGHKVLVWTTFDAESQLLAEALGDDRDVALLTGKTREKDRLAILERFRTGDLQVLLTRASMLGYGQNLQCCTSMVFSGWSDSYEDYYQAVRRAYRHGQTQPLRVHIPVIPQLEADQLDNIWAKQDRHEAAIEEMERNYITSLRG